MIVAGTGSGSEENKIKLQKNSSTDDSAAYATDNLKQTMSEYHEEELPV